jgi:hypothetical protein
MALRHGNRICARVRRRLIYPREVRCGKLRLHRRLLLLPINATSSFPYVFRLQYPRVLHCRIVPIKKLTIVFVFGRKNPPVNHLGSKYKTNHLKVTRNLRENFSWTHDGRGGGGIFTKRLFKMAEILFSWGVSEIECIIFKENNDNPYEINNIYIKLSIVFHLMIIFFRK